VTPSEHMAKIKSYGADFDAISAILNKHDPFDVKMMLAWLLGLTLGGTSQPITDEVTHLTMAVAWRLGAERGE